MKKSLDVVFSEPMRVELIESSCSGPAAREITLKARLSMISTGTETFCLGGQFDPDTHWAKYVTFPFNPGYSMVAEVVAKGDEVNEFDLGDRLFCGTAHKKYFNINIDGEDVFFKIPDDIADEAATWSMLAFITQTAVRRAEHRLGDTAVVIGAGPLGLLIVQYLKISGLQNILVIDLSETRLELAEKLGATHCFKGYAQDALEYAGDLTSGRLADVVYDVTGNFKVFPAALKLPRQFGTVVLVGDCPQPSKQHLSCDVITRQLKIIGSHNFLLEPNQAHWTAEKQANLFYDYITRGQMDTEALVSERIEANMMPDMYHRLLQDRSETMGILVEW